MSLKKLLSLGVCVVFLTMFVYLFAANIKPAIYSIKNSGSSSSSIYTILIRIYYFLFSLSGILTIIFLLPKLNKQDSRAFLRALCRMMSLLVTMILIFPVTDTAYIFSKFEVVKYKSHYLIPLIVYFVSLALMNIGIKFKKNSILRKTIVAIAVILLLIFVIKVIKTYGSLIGLIKREPSIYHIYPFILIGSLTFFGYVCGEDLIE